VLALLLGLLLPTTAVLLYDVQATRETAMEDLKRDLARTSERFAFPTGTVLQDGTPLLNYSAVVALRDWKKPA